VGKNLHMLNSVITEDLHSAMLNILYKNRFFPFDTAINFSTKSANNPKNILL